MPWSRPAFNKEARPLKAVGYMEYDDSTVRQMVECIKVYPGGKLEIIFGGGYLVEETVWAQEIGGSALFDYLSQNESLCKKTVS